ncbi:MAG: DUF998 domain-containing protein [Bacteroidetes bacterium]|nr:DUF998 domain-containing protein [Bacteroidota bacterium]
MTSKFGIAGVVLFIATTIIGGMLIPGYSHVSQLISESYAVDLPYSPLLRFAGYLPAGICITVFSFLALKKLPASTFSNIGFVGMGIFYGMGTIVVSLFPCDKGCPNELTHASMAQVIHTTTGLLTYFIVPLCLFLLGVAARSWPRGKMMVFAGFLSGLITVIFIGKFSGDLVSVYAGLYQRIVESAILGWILLCSFYLKRNHE